MGGATGRPKAMGGARRGGQSDNIAKKSENWKIYGSPADSVDSGSDVDHGSRESQYRDLDPVDGPIKG